jgi:hypothetical protein
MTTPPRHTGQPMIRRVLEISWWGLFPCFAVLTLRLSVERACGDPYDLLPAMTADPTWAWLLAVVYLLAHLWMLAAYLVTIDDGGSLVPSTRVIRGVWGSDVSKVLLMSAALVIEYWPVSLWRWLGTSVTCR